MTSKLVVNEIAADTGISTITVGDNMSGVTFKTGTSNLHNVGIEIAGINVLGADTPIGAGATIYNSGDVLVGGAVTATAFSGSGASLTGLTAGQIPNLAASKITSGTVATARLGSGTANSSTFLRGDGSWAANTSTTINNNANNRLITGSGTANTLEGETNLTYDGANQLKMVGSGQQDFMIGSTNAGGAYLILDGDSNGDAIGADYSYIAHDTGGDVIIGADNPSGDAAIIFKAGDNAEKARINSTGELGIGVAAASGNLLHIKTSSADSKAKIESESGYDARLQLDTSNGGGAGAHLDFQMDGTTKGGIEYVNNASSAAVNSMIFRTGSNTERLRITSGGVVQIGGATSNSADIDTSNTKLTIKQSANNQEDGIYIERSGERRGWYQYVGGALSSSDALCFTTNQLGSDTHVLAMDRNGNVKIGAGNLIFSTGGNGIDFSAHGNASGMSNEVLNDYEEGTWTPGASGFTMGTVTSATYTKIGRLAFVQCYINTASGSGGSTLIITGLPFTVKSGNLYQYATGRIGSGSYNNSQHMITFEFQTGGTTVIPKVSDGNINWGMASNTHIMFSGCYQV